MIVYYDGQCGMCSALARFCRGIRKAESFHFIPLHLVSKEPATEIIVVFAGQEYRGANAVLCLLQHLGGGYKLLYYLFNILPPTWLQWMYRWVAVRRYLLFGKHEQCQIS